MANPARPVSGASDLPVRDDLERLLQRIARGDEVAFADFYRATVRRAYGLAVRILADHGTAEEATLDAYQQVWRTAIDYRRDRATPLTWLLLLVRSRALDARRTAAAGRRHLDRQELGILAADLQAAEPGPMEATRDAERAALVRTATARLPRGQREAIAAAFFGGLSHTEIASALDLPLGTVKTRIRAGMVELRRSLAARGENWT
jgi:RNA polymerase sigma-70 factor (ECF subfamily)